MAAPSMTFNQTLLASQSLAGNASVNANLDISAKFEAQVQVKNTGGGTVSSTNGLEITVWRNVSDVSAPRWDTEPILQFVIPTTANTEKEQSFVLSTGHYRIRFRNLDATNGIAVDGRYATVDAVS